MPNILNKKMTNQTFTNQNQSPNLGANTNQTLNNSFENNAQNQENKGGIINVIAQCLPFAPMLFEQMTGQKIPQMTGTIADIQSAINQLTIGLQTIITNQQQIYQRITNLETSASNQLINLDKRIENLNSVRLTHEKERKQIEYNQPNL